MASKKELKAFIRLARQHNKNSIRNHPTGKWLDEALKLLAKLCK